MKMLSFIMQKVSVGQLIITTRPDIIFLNDLRGNLFITLTICTSITRVVISTTAIVNSFMIFTKILDSKKLISQQWVVNLSLLFQENANQILSVDTVQES